ncbi:hypothetical protein PHLCEN_2v2436 [Hermanssonia centrifuga]|uniref:Uncharacterized protein n=1 Tax=Hermanssonia centrifuga TaxID=98765 RepID=A0A2R6RLW4_9APHY|nr:hypothetical protein PHLCEN_2v2436 [Hermanssonia centrifuga]
MSDSETDPSFSVLPARLRRRIDRAFDNALNEAAHHSKSHAGPSRKKRKLDTDVSSGGGFISSEPGGFIVDGDTAPGGFMAGGAGLGGGFVVDDTPAGGLTSESSEDERIARRDHHTHIPFDLIPSALQVLDLQPDDEDVLSVFRNAASGWEGPQRGAPNSEAELLVSRKDWRAVCAALLDSPNVDEDEGPVDNKDRGEDEDGAMAELDGVEESDDGEEYEEIGDDSSEEADGSDDEYQEGGFVQASTSKGKTNTKTATKVTTSKRKGQRQTTSSPSTSESDTDQDLAAKKNARITSRQRDECRRTFSLFFPDVLEKDLNQQKIMIKDISRIADLLKEKITAEEIIEMLEAFSTSADKSMNLSDFEVMMITAKLA